MRGRRPDFANGHRRFVGGLGGLGHRRLDSANATSTRNKPMKNLIFAAKPLVLDLMATLL